MRSTRSFDSCHRNRLSLLHSPLLCLNKFSGTSPSEGSSLTETVSFLLRRGRSLDQGFIRIATWREDFPHHFWRRPSWDYHIQIPSRYILFPDVPNIFQDQTVFRSMRSFGSSPSNATTKCAQFVNLIPSEFPTNIS